MAHSLRINNFFLSARRRWPAAVVAILVVLLSGCATRLETSVTRFHQWPANTRGATYAIAPVLKEMQDAPLLVARQQQPFPADEAIALSGLEFNTYAGYLERNLQAQGLVPAVRQDHARMIVSMEIHSRSGMAQEFVPGYRPMLGVGMSYRWFHWSYGPFAYAPWGDYYGSMSDWGTRTVMRPVQHYRLRLRIADRGQSTMPHAAAPAVYDASASSTGRPLALPVVRPYLVRAVFDGFPGSSGKTQQVIFDSKTGERLPIGAS